MTKRVRGWKEQEAGEQLFVSKVRILEIEANSWQLPLEECRPPPCTSSPLIHLFVLSSFSFAGYFDVPNLIEGIRRTDPNFVFIDCCFVQRLLSEGLQDAGAFCKRYLIRNPFDMTFKFRRLPLPLSVSQTGPTDSLCCAFQ